MTTNYYFPFGSPLKKVEQKDRSPKKVFVLGVYASAVHAKWIGADGKQKVAALAVASEPEIFWTGKNAEAIIRSINIPAELGRLVPANSNLNGPSGRSLDEQFLKPLGFTREDVWLCDLLPESRKNEGQAKAIKKHYTEEIMHAYDLTPANIPDFMKKELDSTERRAEILNELEQSQADTIVLLGDEPIRWFLNFFDNRYRKLSDFGGTPDTYGKEHLVDIGGKFYKVIPLCHPRNASRLGSSSKLWGELHDNWVEEKLAE